MLMVSFRSGFVRERQNSDRVGGGMKVFDLPTFVLLLAAARTLPAALAAANAAAQPELRGFSVSAASTGSVVSCSVVCLSPLLRSSTEGVFGFSETRRRRPSPSLSETSSRTSTDWLLRRPPCRSSSTSGLRCRVATSSVLCSKSSSTGDDTSAFWNLTDVILTYTTILALPVYNSTIIY